jgi:hypothetical protein
VNHSLVITDDNIDLKCDCAGPCKEQEYVERYGFDEFTLWPSGSHPVTYVSGFDDDAEFDERLAPVNDVLPDVYEPAPLSWTDNVLRGDFKTWRTA